MDRGGNPLPHPSLFPAHIFLRRPRNLNAFKRLASNLQEKNQAIIIKAFKLLPVISTTLDLRLMREQKNYIRTVVFFFSNIVIFCVSA